MNVDQAAPIDLIWHGDPDGTPLKEWLIDEMLPRTGLALIAGQWGTHKTFVMLDLSASVMTKAQFAGREVHRRGGVLLLAKPNSPEVIDSPFYALAPQWSHYPLVLLATVATVIASQSMISGAYSMTQ